MRVDPLINSQESVETKKIDVIAHGSLIIDDVVFDNGSTSMEQIGGSVVYAAAGARLSGASVGVWAFAGQNYYLKIKNHLQRNGINTDGLIAREVSQPRAWQYFSKDASRREVFQTPWPEVRLYNPHPEEWPTGITCSSGYLFWSQNILESVNTFRQVGAQTLVWEPPDDLINPSRDRKYILDVLPLVDAVCPNLQEWIKLFNLTNIEDLIELALKAGVKLIALRLGAEGSILATKEMTVRLPVEPLSSALDFTGAGNAYCGALAAAIQQVGSPKKNQDLEKIGAFATVASSVTIESIGTPRINNHEIQSYQNRVQKYLQRLS
jgi:sugar/nucleoside kinase (ribokinase family)